ncbi:MAG: Hsp70 family protein, partial [Clostridia bacterium]|nr:Hsp70 family protein [Clostridia bacterium]
PIEVTGDRDTIGILKVSAQDLGTGRAQEITIAASTNLSEAEIQRAIQDAKNYAEQDVARKQAMERRNEAEALAVECKNALTACGKELNKPTQKQIKSDLAALDKLLHKKIEKPFSAVEPFSGCRE